MEAYIAEIEGHSASYWPAGPCTVVYFAGCNFSCPNCNSPHMLSAASKNLLQLSEVKKVIRENRSAVKSVVFTGGEPCLQKLALAKLCSYTRDLGLMTVIETNASKPECVHSLLSEGIANTIVLDIKSPFEPVAFERATRSRTFFKSTESVISDIRTTIRLLYENRKRADIMVRTVVTPRLVHRKEDLARIGSEIEHLNCSWVLRPFVARNVSNRVFCGIKSPSTPFVLEMQRVLSVKFPGIRVFSEIELS